MGHGYLIFLLLINTLVPFSSGKPDRVCISQGSRFPPFSSEGKPPKRVSKGPKDLTLCRVFRKKTCCDVAQTHPALLAIRKLASAGEANPECLQLWELLECSICDPRIGVQPGPPVICASFCDRIFKACSDAYYSTDAITQVLAPCGVNDYVCGRASEWILNGTEFCHAAGFSFKDDTSESLEETFCYGGKASLDLIADSWKISQSEVPQKVERLRQVEELQQRVREMPYSERVSWAVGGLVLTAGLLFISRRKGHNQRHRQAALQRTTKKLEAKINQKSADTHGNRKITIEVFPYEHLSLHAFHFGNFNHSVLNACGLEACYELEEGSCPSMHSTCVPFNHSVLNALQHTTKKLEAKINQKSADTHGNRKACYKLMIVALRRATNWRKAVVLPCIPFVSLSIIRFSMLVALRRATSWRKAVCPSMHYTCVPFNHPFSMLVALRGATRWSTAVLEPDSEVLIENLKGQHIVMQILKKL